MAATKQFFVVRLDPDGDYVDDWSGVADSFDTLEEAKQFIMENASSHPGVEYIAAQALTVGVAPLPTVLFTDVNPPPAPAAAPPAETPET